MRLTTALHWGSSEFKAQNCPLSDFFIIYFSLIIAPVLEVLCPAVLTKGIRERTGFGEGTGGEGKSPVPRCGTSLAPQNGAQPLPERGMGRSVSASRAGPGTDTGGTRTHARGVQRGCCLSPARARTHIAVYRRRACIRAEMSGSPAGRHRPAARRVSSEQSEKRPPAAPPKAPRSGQEPGPARPRPARPRGAEPRCPGPGGVGGRFGRWVWLRPVLSACKGTPKPPLSCLLPAGSCGGRAGVSPGRCPPDGRRVPPQERPQPQPGAGGARPASAPSPNRGHGQPRGSISLSQNQRTNEQRPKK